MSTQNLLFSQPPEAQELAALEGANMQTIMDVYDALRRDADVGERIKRILEHE